MRPQRTLIVPLNNGPRRGTLVAASTFKAYGRRRGTELE